MLKKILKWTLIIVAVVVLVVIVVGWILVKNTDNQMEQLYEVEPHSILIPDDSASIANGRIWAMGLCSPCHGTDFSGINFFDDPALGHMDSPNLTKGLGGIGAEYTDTDWIRTIKHGVKPDGKGIFVMPSDDFNKMSDEDLGELIAYLKTITPVDKKLSTIPDLTVMAKILIALGAFGEMFSAEIIDHEAGSSYAPEYAPTSEYGSYLVDVFGCRTCHGLTLNGGKDPDPAAPFGPNITPGGNLGKWSREHFITTIRTGMTPEKKALDLKFMPWPGQSLMADDQLTAIYLYLKSQPKLDTPEEYILKQ